MNKKHILLPLVALCMTGNAFSQTLTQARTWFLNGEFEKAKPVFKKLVKQAPSNANYNFWYGACCYETGEKNEALPYLKKSAARKVTNAYLYLGKLYYDQYKFDDAATSVEDHIALLQKQKNANTEAAESLLDKCRRASRMLRSTEKIAVIDSFVVDKQEFLSAYKLSKESGTISLNEQKNGTNYENELGDKMIYTKTSADNETHLYTKIKLIDKWSDSEQLSELSNAGHNQNYPFMAADGITLYFAAQGDESLGGYDIFVTRYDSDSNSYFRPDNIGMPFNSTYNDYMYAVDDLNNLGWFASDRYQPADKVCVYVFVPNESKETYDYENTDTDKVINAATLGSIRSTWTDADKVRLAKQRLAQVMYSTANSKNKKDFSFIIDDGAVYTSLNDFRSKEAQAQYQSLMQKQKDLSLLEEALNKQRNAYQKGSKEQKEQLAPAILDKEKRIDDLRSEIETLKWAVRNTEIKALGKKK